MTFEIARYSVGDTSEDVLRERWEAAVAAIRERFGGLVEANLVRMDGSTWIDLWAWESKEAALKAAEQAPSVPEAAALFELIVGEPVMEHGEVFARA